MPRRSHNTHFDAGRREQCSYGEIVVGLCGEEKRWRDNVTTEETKVTCGACASKLLQPKVDAHVPSLYLEKAPSDEARTRGRAVYRAYLGGEHVAYVVLEGAFAATRWEIATIRERNKEHPKYGWTEEETASKAHVGYHLEEDPTSNYSHTLTFVCKEAALLAVPELVAKKRLRTLKQAVADREDYERRLAEGEKRHEERRAALETERKETLAGLTEVRDGHPLTNFQRSAIERAILEFSKPMLE